MSRIWKAKKATLTRAAREFHGRSPALQLLGIDQRDDEWRSRWMMTTSTLAQRADGTVHRAGPVVLGVRYHESFLSEAPHPCEIVTIMLPPRVFHPNATAGGTFCLGHPEAGLSLEFILSQAWAGLTLNMRAVNTRGGDILNPEAAQYVRANAERLPLTEKGMFEPPDFGGPGAKRLWKRTSTGATRGVT